MNVQAQVSGPGPGPGPGQVSSQLGQQNLNPQQLPGQNTNAGSSGGSGHGNISRDERIIKARKHMLQRICHIFRKKHSEPLNDAQRKKYTDLIKQMEDMLFRSAPNMEEYMNVNTLEQRLQMLTKRYTMNNNKQLHQHINSSSSISATMIPTPGMSHCGNPNVLNISSVDASVVSTRNSMTTTRADTGSLLPTGKERSMARQGSLSNESHQQSPANFSVTSAGNNMPSVGGQRMSSQTISTSGFIGGRSSAGPDTSNNDISSTVAPTFVAQQQQKKYAARNSSTMENLSSQLGCSGSILQQKSNRLSNEGLCGDIGLIGNNVQLGNGFGTSGGYSCAASSHKSAKPLSLQPEHHNRPLTKENSAQSSEQQYQPQQLYVEQQYQLKTQSQHGHVMVENEALNQAHRASNLGSPVKSMSGSKNHGINQQQQGFEQFQLPEFENRLSSMVDSSKAAHLVSTSSNQHNGGSNIENLQHKQKFSASQIDNNTLPTGMQPEAQVQDRLQCQSLVCAQMSGNISHEQEDFCQRVSGQEEHQPDNTSECVNKSMVSRDTAEFSNSCGATCRTKNSDREKQYINQQRWLLFLKHARICSAPQGECQEPRCVDVQILMKHISQCAKADCRFPRCIATKELIIHSRNCKNTYCPVCVPVKHIMCKRLKANGEPESENTSARSSLKSVSESLENIQPPPKRLKTGQPHSPVVGEVKTLVSASDVTVSCLPQNVQKQDCHHGETSMAVQSKVKEIKVSATGARENALIVETTKNATHCQNNILNTDPTKLNDPAGYGKEESMEVENCSSVPKQENLVQPTDRVEIKSRKPKITGGVSLTELFTPDQIRQHICSLRQWIGQSKAKAEKNQAIGHSMNENSCQLCGIERLTFEPPPIYCAPCGVRIKRNGTYYTVGSGEARQSFCIPCYNESRGDSIVVDGLPIAKSRLEKKKNDEETEEWWVQCDKCEAWQHQICALFNGKKNDGGQAEYTCSNCYLAEVEKGERHPLPLNAVLGAEDLPKTKLSRHLEERVIRKLKEDRDARAMLQGTTVEMIPSAEELVIRVVSSVDKKLEVKPRFLEIFQEESYPTDFPYKSKVVLLFQRIEGVEVCLFGMYVQEYGAECAFPNQRRVYLSYLDSVKYFRPDVKAASGEALRTFVYHEILIGYLEYCKMRGFTSCYIWACPPLKGEDYILYCHPEIQKTPRSDKLRDWYLSMLKKASKDEIVVELTNLYDHFFVHMDERRAKVTASRLPYFDGDYWPGSAEDLIYQMQQEVDGRKPNRKGSTKKTISKRALKAFGQSDISGTASKDLLLMNKLGETICPMKEDFIMVHLQHCCKHCCVLMVSGTRWVCQQCKNFQLCDKCFGAEQNREERERHPVNQKEKHTFNPIQITGVPFDTKDEDEILESEFFDTRQAFLSLCQGNHYQYDTLRRAKHSSMMVLYHLHNPTAPAFVSTCNVCHLDIEAGHGWRCEVCPDYDVCNACYQREGATKHPHKLTKSTTAGHDGQNKEASQRRIKQLRKTLNLLVHASQCRMTQCQYSSDCRKVKGLFRHGIQCKVRLNGGCSLCKKMWSLLQLHARTCKESQCFVPRCQDLKKHLNRMQQQAESRRRAAVNEWSRIRAAEVSRNNV